MATVDSGYIGAQATWNERINFCERSSRRAWQITKLLAVVTAFSLFVSAWVVLRSNRRLVSVIGINEVTGQTVFSGVAHDRPTSNPALERGALTTWIERWRFVSTDREEQKQAVEEVVYSHIAEGSPARAAIDDWYRSNPPQERSKGGTVTVEVRNVLPTGDRTYEADWVEHKWAGGAEASHEHWRGAFSVARAAPTDERMLRLNPLGLYVTVANWSLVVDERSR